MKDDYYFSPSSKLFYPVVHADLYRNKGNLPEDVIAVDESTFRRFLPENKPAGKQIGCNISGRPCWVNESPPTKEESQQWAAWNKERLSQQVEAVIAPLERAARLGIATEEEAATLLVWERYSVLLSRIDPQQGSLIEWPEKPQ